MDLLEEIKSFKPIDIDKISQDSSVSQKVIDSVKSYNKAIENLRTGSEDIAMIELKKVVSSNPDFYEAINLLGLCYAYTKQLDKAEELFGRVVQNESDVIKAADYLKYIGKADYSAVKSAGSNIKNKKAVKKVTETNIKENPKKELPAEYILFRKIGKQLKKTSVAVAINIISILLMITAVVFFVQSTKADNQTVIKDSQPAADTKLTRQYEAVVAENKFLQEQLKSAEAKLKELQLTTDISLVSTLYSQKKYVESADKLLALSANDMTADQKKKYDSIKDDVLLKAANQLTIEGNSLYNAKKYSEAIIKLEKVFTLGDKWSFGDKALYILGKSYVEVNDQQKGAETYRKLIAAYPNSTYTKYAKSRLDAIS